METETGKNSARNNFFIFLIGTVIMFVSAAKTESSAEGVYWFFSGMYFTITILNGLFWRAFRLEEKKN